jgi:hypothetical protein
VNNEVTEVSNKTILAELAEAKSTISRLTTSAARSVGCVEFFFVLSWMSFSFERDALSVVRSLRERGKGRRR